MWCLQSMIIFNWLLRPTIMQWCPFASCHRHRSWQQGLFLATGEEGRSCGGSLYLIEELTFLSVWKSDKYRIIKQIIGILNSQKSIRKNLKLQQNSIKLCASSLHFPCMIAASHTSFIKFGHKLKLDLAPWSYISTA